MDYRASRRNTFWTCGLAVAADLWRVSPEDAAVVTVRRWYFINTMLNLPLRIKSCPFIVTCTASDLLDVAVVLVCVAFVK